ncbi:hypothetical protein Micbo1qcDRAFT_121839 [Microdochium bolleyi]|uniref:Uncharacterized protein n=1 Tax=Microdochium bolleyi TaxID=196109 RepID=A0A136IWC3_9PEZI|nr:hypothetical protein Micbo1qcDRAFT_121839 [Microdochium bolleyi]
MPGLAGFSDNPLQSRDDVARAARALLRPLVPHFSPGRARVCIPSATSAHFDETAAKLEGFARPLWALSALLLGADELQDLQLVHPWLDGFETGPDPNHPEYWGDIEDYDQRMVEAETISIALLVIPQDILWRRLSSQAQHHLIAWLSTILDCEIHAANWLWFRVFACLALLKTCGVDTAKLRTTLKTDLEALDNFYMGDGWSSDGQWRTTAMDDEELNNYKQTGKANTIPLGRAADYYSGSFAIQFSQLLYTHFAGDLDATRTERYREQARLFGANFVQYFDAGGAAIPFGRSLVYRFACGGYFAALAVAKVPDMPACLATQGAIKGFLLRHLRWWARHSGNIFHVDGTLNLGWTYPQMYLTEDYNSPQSVYWAMKAFFCVALSAEDDFWTSTEEGYPQPTLLTKKNLPDDQNTSHEILLATVKIAGPHGQITCNHPGGNHHFLLNSAQFIAIPFKGVQAKYSKFAYSSSFGFSVPSGAHGLSQLAPDSVLALSRDGTQTWAVKYKCSTPRYSMVSVISSSSGHVQRGLGQVPIVTVEWWPWADRQVAVHTTLIPPTDRWPDWHIRVHRIKVTHDAACNSCTGGPYARLFTVEGGFAIHGQQAGNNRVLKHRALEELTDSCQAGEVEGVYQTAGSVLVASEQGMSGIVADQHCLPPGQPAPRAMMLAAEPNTNIMRQKSVIPCIEGVVRPWQGRHSNPGQEEREDVIVLVTKVFAISSEGNGGRDLPAGSRSLRQRWLDVPRIAGVAGALLSEEGEDYISIPAME